jgi:prepilin-type N-terminal cleavage/methylation domain-containing protein
MNNNQNDKGFTLVELLIVIVILGILATVTVFAVRGITDQGQTSACASDKKTLQVAVEAFIAQNGSLGTGTLAVTEANMVPGFLVSQSPNYNVGGSPAFAVTAAPNDSTATPAFVNKCT